MGGIGAGEAWIALVGVAAAGVEDGSVVVDLPDFDLGVADGFSP